MRFIKMKKLKITLSVIMIIAVIFSFAACASDTAKPGSSDEAQSTTDEQREVKTRVAALNGPTGIGLAKVKTDRAYGYDVTFYNDPQEIVPLLVNGETDIAAVPLNLAANIYKKTNGGIKILAINTLGVLHVLEKGDTISSVADLKGKTVFATGQGSTPEYTINYILEKNGIDRENDLTVEYKSAHPELATLAIEGKADICILPEPFASKVIASGKGFRRALDLTEEWNKVSDAPLAMGCVVARKEYIETNPDIISEFMTFNEVSVNFMNTSPSAAVVLADIGMITPDQIELYAEAIAGCNIVFIDGEEMKKTAEENFAVLFEADPVSVGGELPDENIYYPG